MNGMSGMTGAVADLGLGNMLAQQRDNQLDDEERKKRLSLSPMGLNPLNFGMTGVASADLGMPSAGRR